MCVSSVRYTRCGRTCLRLPSAASSPAPRRPRPGGCSRAIGAGQSAERSLSTVVYNSVDCTSPTESGCPQMCAPLWKRTPYEPRSLVVSRETCGSPLQIARASGVAPRCSGLLRMPVRAPDAIHATPASADSLPWGVPRETESPGPGTCVRRLVVHDPRRRRVRGIRGTSCPASAGPVVPTWRVSVAGNSAVSVAVIPSCQLAQCTVPRETLAKVRRPGLSDRSYDYVASRDAW